MKEIITKYLGLSNATNVKIYTSISIVIISWIVYYILIGIASNRIEEIKLKYRVKKTVGYSIMTISFLLIGRIWFVGITSLTTFLGLFSAGIAISLKEVLMNIAGWLFILWRKPFEVGDRIEIDGVAGDVIDLRIFEFTILEIGNWVHADQSTGRIIHIPNGKVLESKLANYNKGFQFIWNEIEVVITFESDWKKAKKILQNVSEKYTLHLSKEAEEKVKKAAKKYMIYYNNFSPIVYTEVVDCGVKLTIRHLCPPKKRRGFNQNIWEKILEEFDENENINLAYPTIRYTR